MFDSSLSGHEMTGSDLRFTTKGNGEIKIMHTLDPVKKSALGKIGETGKDAAYVLQRQTTKEP